MAFASFITTGVAVSAPTEPAGRTGAGAEMRAGAVQPGKVSGISAQSSSSGANSADFTGDGRPDILARQADNGVLKVYPHSGTFNGTGTYQAATTISYGWGGFRWIGTGFVNNDSLPDVVGIDGNGVLKAYPHSGSFNGTGTITAPTVLGYGWNINDLIVVGDFTGDGLTDIMARQVGGNILNLYQHSGSFSGTSTYLPPVAIVIGVANAVDINFGDFTRDGYPDLLFQEPANTLGVFSFQDGPKDSNGNPTGWSWDLGYGWNITNFIGVTDVNSDGAVDVLGRRQNGELYVYPHSGTFNPNNALTTLNGPVYLGAGWNTNNVIS
ncbi:MAG: VCBS repeat-containing protein [Umezawaea sp.]